MTVAQYKTQNQLLFEILSLRSYSEMLTTQV